MGYPPVLSRNRRPGGGAGVLSRAAPARIARTRAHQRFVMRSPQRPHARRAAARKRPPSVKALTASLLRASESPATRTLGFSMSYQRDHYTPLRHQMPITKDCQKATSLP